MIKALENDKSILFNFDLIFYYFIMFLFPFLNYWLILFNSCMYYTLNPIAELVIPIRITTKEAKEEIETHQITVEAIGS